MDDPRDRCLCCDKWFQLIHLSDQSLCEGCSEHLCVPITGTRAENKIKYVGNVVPFKKVN